MPIERACCAVTRAARSMSSRRRPAPSPVTSGKEAVMPFSVSERCRLSDRASVASESEKAGAASVQALVWVPGGLAWMGTGPIVCCATRSSRVRRSGSTTVRDGESKHLVRSSCREATCCVVATKCSAASSSGRVESTVVRPAWKPEFASSGGCASSVSAA